MREKFSKPYDPKAVEEDIYKRWEESGFFNPDTCIEKGVAKPDAPTFSIVLPPPNVTGTLHLGHAEMLVLQDILVRFNRMRGKRTLWLPGTDHAAIATQSKVEEILYKKEEKTRHNLGREEFLKRVEEFAKESHDTITKQIRAMGSSVDWSREAYTLDEKRSLAVRTAFKKMFGEGLIYRGNRIVNWDPKLKTVVSDDELEYKEETTNFYYLKYGPFTIGTARPETKFGDKYVVMHPDDKRYGKYKHGEKIEVDWINGKITATILKDPSIDMDFGTGVMTITPFHSFQDFDLAKKYDLSFEQIIDEGGKLLSIAGEFAGAHIKKARPLMVEKIKEKGLLEKVDEKYVHNVAINSRGGGTIEPQVMKQWFIDVNKEFTIPHSKIPGIPSGSKTTLKEIMRQSVLGKKIKIIPENYEKVYYHWIDNLRDWCISRQIWYGHRIPVWYHDTCGAGGFETAKFQTEPIVSITPPGKCPYCEAKLSIGGDKINCSQDPDTLDTWFSSGLWTFSTLGWPENTNDLKTYHPTSVLETGYDILFFWVARMILMSGYHLGEVPFETVYLHGLVRDGKGRKMSKSLGNIIDPLDMINKYGADATRLSLVIGASAGVDIKISEDKIRGYKNFANKIWNASRFVLESTKEIDLSKESKLNEKDSKTLGGLSQIISEVTDDLENFRFHLAGEKLYHYFWHTFADVIIEESKSRLRGEDKDDKASCERLLYTILTTMLKAIHPFMPFVTEEIWHSLPHNKDKKLLMIENWPN